MTTHSVFYSPGMNPLATPLERESHNAAGVSSPSYFLASAFQGAQISASSPHSPRTRSPPDLPTPKSTAPPKNLSSRRSPVAGGVVMGTAAEDSSGFFAAATVQNRPIFNLADWGGFKQSATFPPPTPASPSFLKHSSPRIDYSPRSESPQSYLTGVSGPVAGPSSLSMGHMPARRSSAGRLHASSRFASISPSELATNLDESTLVLDLRPHAAFISSAGHVVDSINICVPTTLLRRSNYSLSRIAETLVKHERLRLLDSIKTCDRVVVLDQDATTLHHDGILHALLAKFEREGFKGDLLWLKGGFVALTTSISANELDQPIITSDSDGSGSSGSSLLSLGNSAFSSSTSSLSSTESADSSAPSKRQASPVLRCRDLPVSAFQVSSTQQYMKDQTNQQMPAESQAGDTVMKVQTANARQAANPFFDNIRQNQESLSEERSLQNLQPYEVPDVFVSDKAARAKLPPFLQALIDLPPSKRAELLARDFFSIEEREQHRLQQLMTWHASRDQTVAAEQDNNPLSISAGVEKGHLNRYRNVFPYEHTRVRLLQHNTGESDYINASRIDVRGTTHTYIATQGPMASSFDDFWQLIFQERINVIVMLTNLREAGREKCGAYYRPGRYGRITVETLDSCSVAAVEDAKAAGRRGSAVSDGGFFGPQSPAALTGTIRRFLKITSDDQPDRPLLVRHIHFASWPDFDVPPSPQEVISLIKEVNDAKARSNAPVLVHCSAGVGRTGCFIAVDTVLDSILHPGQKMTPMATDGDASQGGLLPSRGQLTPPIFSESPIYAVVNEIREQRMNMVANAGQYRFIYTAILQGLLDLAASA